MRTPLLLSVAIVAGALTAPAIAAPTCLLEVDGRRYIDGSCHVTEVPRGFLIAGPSRHIAVLRPDPINSSRATAAWDGNFHNGPAQAVPLGDVRRDGISCWRNVHTRICVWR
jgi:hypothetical protein